ncbi:hypothetical protein ACI3K5_23845 [Streptomyces sp. MPA0124]|uniref:hypothetical protein n=1 Tax=Streptomyces sp. MPA0124 TaxID=3378069 RepID=UPI0038536A80
MTDQIRVPWTSEQVAVLEQFQTTSGMHPFTCGADQHTLAPRLVPSHSGWYCPDPDCDYRQDWAHAFMADPSAWPRPFADLRQPETTEATEAAEQPAEPWTQLEARAFNAVLPALREAGEWLPLTARRKVARAVLEAVQAAELQAAIVRVRELADDAEYGTYTVDVDTLRSALPEPPPGASV